jgi:hypothetical protein
MKSLRIKKLLGLGFIVFFFFADAQTNIKTFAGFNYQIGLLHSQLNILKNGISLNYGIYPNNGSLLSISANIDYANSIGNDLRDCNILMYGFGVTGLFPAYRIILPKHRLQTYFSGGLYYNFSKVNSYSNESFLQKQNINYPFFKIGGAINLPFRKTAYVKMPFLKHSHIFLNIHETGYINNNVSSFYKAHSNIGTITWGQELGFLFIYMLPV